jgi:uncharacterized membrane protein
MKMNHTNCKKTLPVAHLMIELLCCYSFNWTVAYLSWTRNCFLCTVIGVAIYEQKELFSRSDISARTFFGLGFLNLAIGSYQHIEGAYRHQQALCLSRAALFGISAYTISGAILWIVGIAIYLS